MKLQIKITTYYNRELRIICNNGRPYQSHTYYTTNLTLLLWRWPKDWKIYGDKNAIMHFHCHDPPVGSSI